MVRFNLVITLLLMISIAVKAELTNRMFDVRHVGYAEGLSSQRVFSIVEDGDGAMWIATKTGIDRYNGHTVKNYDLPGSFYYGDLAGRRLYLLYDAQQGLFAYDHTGRIYRYSTILDHFEQVLHPVSYTHLDVYKRQFQPFTNAAADGCELVEPGPVQRFSYCALSKL